MQAIGLSYAEIAEAEEFRRSFKLFAKAAWHVIEPGTPLLWNWHLDVICDHLQAVYERRIKRLVITLAPGHAKSSFISQLFPDWCWLNNSYLRWLCASHSLDLAIRDNKYRRDLIESEWFQERYGSFFKLSSSQNVKSFFQNDHRGYMMATAVRSSGTGKRADFLLIDDPNNAMAGLADIEATKEWFGKTWMSRLNDQEEGPMVVVGQRLDEKDLIAHILKLGGWEHLNLPEEYEPASACRTYLVDASLPVEQKVTVPSFTDPDIEYEVTFKDGKAADCTCPDFIYRQQTCKHMKRAKAPERTPFWQDPRTEAGELLWPEKFPREVLDKLKRGLGPLHYSAQYQQSPIPSGGFIYKEKDRRWFSVDQQSQSYLLETPRGRVTIPIKECWNLAVVDLAVSTKSTADYFLMETWAITPYKDALLLHALHEHLDFPEQQRQIPLLFQRFKHNIIAVEKVGYQLAMIQYLISLGLPIRPFQPQADKITRSTMGSILYSNGKVYHNRDMSGIEEAEKELFAFPKAPHDEYPDCHAMMALVVSPYGVVGIFDLDEDTSGPDTMLSIEAILGIEQIVPEPDQHEEVAKEQEAVRIERDPFAFAAHALGDDW